MNVFNRPLKKILAQLGFLNPFREPFKEIEFETTTFCNRKCVYCPNSKYERTGSEDGRYMKEEVFEKLLSDLSDIDFRGLIAPHLYGEPLTDPRLVSWISKIRKTLPKSRIKVVTNGDFFDEKKYIELTTAGTDYFCISKHSSSLSQNVTHLMSTLKEEERLKKFKIFDYYEDFKNKQIMLNTRGGEVNLKKNSLRHPICCEYVSYPVINTFGDLILCCNDYHGRYVFGNIMKRHLLEIWQDPYNIKLRKRIYKGRFDLPICQNCWI